MLAGGSASPKTMVMSLGLRPTYFNNALGTTRSTSQGMRRGRWHFQSRRLTETAYNCGVENIITTRCVIAGGGPAGMMLGFLLGRAGIDLVVLEKHADFNRDFRGDTIHPSTLELMYELGLLDQFLNL